MLRSTWLYPPSSKHLTKQIQKKKKISFSLLKNNLNMVSKASSYFQEQYFSHKKYNWNVLDETYATHSKTAKRLPLSTANH